MAILERSGLKGSALVLSLMIIVLSASFVSAGAWLLSANADSQKALPNGFYLGVTASGSVEESKALIDKVKDYTNVITFTNLDVTENKTSLIEVCDYAYERGMNFLVFMVYPSPFAKNFTYNPVTWVSEAKGKYGNRFLGYYLWDEPGGSQLDRGSFRQFDNTTLPHSYLDAANTFVYYLYVQIRDFIKTDKLFTADYGLYWYDYEAGYDVVLCNFGWNNSRSLAIAQTRGAAEMHNKTWGAIVTWTYENPPYMETASELYEDMVTAYDAGAKYVVVFNYPQVNEYGLLTEAHFDSVKRFKDYVLANPQNQSSNVEKVAYVLPDNYGFGLRKPDDTIWGVWPADNDSPLIWNGVNVLVEKYGNNFDIIVGSPWTVLFGKCHYDKIVWWNSTG